MSFLLLLALACGRGAHAPAAPAATAGGPSDVSALTAVSRPSGLSWYVLAEGNGPVAATDDKGSVTHRRASGEQVSGLQDATPLAAVHPLEQYSRKSNLPSIPQRRTAAG